MRYLTVTAITVLLLAGLRPAAAVEINFTLQDSETDVPLAARFELTDPLGRHVYPVDQPVRGADSPDYFYAWNTFAAELKTDVEYTLRIGRGLGWEPIVQKFSVSDTDVQATIKMNSWILPHERGWMAGDMDARISYFDPSMAMASEDLSAVFRVVDASSAILETERLSKGFFHLTGKRAYTGRDWGFGDFNVLGSLTEFVESETSFTCSKLDRMALGKDTGGLIDILRMETDDVPAAAALGWVDTVRVVGPSGAKEPSWTRERVMERMEEYYALLNCGFRIPISAGSGATETGFSGEDHLGSSRIYARMFTDFSLGGFIRTVRRGQSWATNGPALTLLVNGRDPSETLDLLTLNRTLDVSFGARSNRRIDRVELIHNGEVVKTLPGSATSSHVMESFRYDVSEPGWLAARVFEVQETPESVFRYAHTSPFYLNVRGQPNYRKETVQDFATRIAQSIRRIEDNETLPEQEKQQVLTWYRQASDKYLEKLR